MHVRVYDGNGFITLVGLHVWKGINVLHASICGFAMNKIPPCTISRIRASAGESYLILAPDNLLIFAAIRRVGLAITRQTNYGVYLYGVGTL
jgi:hypothetical protein